MESAYLHAPIKEKLAIIDDKVNPGKAWLLRSALYGSKQGAHNWEEKKIKAFEKVGLTILKKDGGVAVGPDCWITTHVDDMLVMGKPGKVKEVFEKLRTELELEELGRPTQ